MQSVYINGIITKDEFKQEHENEETFSFNDLVNQLDGAKEALVYINSPGGMVEEGLRIYDYLSKINVHTIAFNASSIASIIFLAGKKRFIANEAEMIIHNAWIKGEDFGDLTLNANSLTMIRNEFEKMDAILVDIYKASTGIEETKLLSLMAVDTDVASEAIQLGFATDIYEDKKVRDIASNRVIMYNQTSKETLLNNKSNKMANEQTEARLNAFEKLLNGVKNIFINSVKNMLVKLQDDVELYVFSEDGEFEGKRAVLADDGMPTEENAPAGTHILEDGREIVVGEGGIIESVSEAVDAEAALQAKEEEMKILEAAKKAMEDEYKEKALLNAELQAKVEALEAQNKADKEEAQAKVNELSEQFIALQKEVIGEELKLDDKTKAMSQGDFSKMSVSDRFKFSQINKAKAIKN